MYSCHIVYHPGNCLNTKKAYVNFCRLCFDSCPHQAISVFLEVETQRCTECGVCMAVCPSDGFVYHTVDELFAHIRSSREIVLNCPQAVPAGYEIPCLGIFDRDLWLALLMAASERQVEIYTGVCGDCPDRQACGRSVQLFNEVYNAWPVHPNIRVIVAPDASVAIDSGSEPDVVGTPNADNASNAVNAHGAGSAPLAAGMAAAPQDEKGSWREQALAKMADVFPVITSDETYLIPKTRQFLAETWKSCQTKFEALPIPVIDVCGKCTGCDDCLAACPQDALTKTECKGQAILVYEPFKCIRCQRCVTICPSQALKMEVKSLSYRLFTGKIGLHVFK